MIPALLSQTAKPFFWKINNLISSSLETFSYFFPLLLNSLQYPFPSEVSLLEHGQPQPSSVGTYFVLVISYFFNIEVFPCCFQLSTFNCSVQQLCACFLSAAGANLILPCSPQISPLLRYHNSLATLQHHGYASESSLDAQLFTSSAENYQLAQSSGELQK